MPCEAGCLSFDGGEKKHHRDCEHYPESLTKLWHDTEAAYIAEIDRLRSTLETVREMTPRKLDPKLFYIVNSALEKR
jgi:hypothetical protein